MAHVVIFGLQGTLVDKDNVPLEKTENVLNYLRSNNYKLCLFSLKSEYAGVLRKYFDCVIECEEKRSDELYDLRNLLGCSIDTVFLVDCCAEGVKAGNEVGYITFLVGNGTEGLNGLPCYVIESIDDIVGYLG